MNWKQRIVLVTGTAIAILVLLVAGAMYALQTSWFKQNVRERVISAVQQATGGRVEIGSFDYNWRTLSAEFRNFVVHGTEPPDRATVTSRRFHSSWLENRFAP